MGASSSKKEIARPKPKTFKDQLAQLKTDLLNTVEKKVEAMTEVGAGQPPIRFGHTVTQVSKSKFVMFGGAYGEPGKYKVTNDCHVFELAKQELALADSPTYPFPQEKIDWLPVESDGEVPCERASHQSCCVGDLQLVVYGGS